jgi:hypothetical protein
MILLNDTIKELINDVHYRTKYRATCDTCGVDRGYLDKKNAQKPHCVKCCIRHTKTSKHKMSLARIGKKPWNKGLKESRVDVVEKMSKAKKGASPANKGKPVPYEQKVKISCAVRGISLGDFDELQTSNAKLERNKFAELGLHIARFELDNYTCCACGVNKVVLNAHHKNSWKHFPDQRFELANLVSLCVTCHREFHSIYGNGKCAPNTEHQIKEFIERKTSTCNTKKTLYVVAGVSGSGKSWVCSQLHNVRYVSYDKVDKFNIRSILWNLSEPVIVYDPTMHVSSFIRRNSDIFDIKLLVILEDENTVRTRLVSRGGVFNDSIKRRMKRIKNLAKGALFSGTSSEVLNFLKQQAY